ncbi:MAG: DsrE family protein [Candidatus Heimdallarchaeota archaeon]|nr:DsrE family protein [Candidatus Heimdallarchaeota archaeon]
MHRVFMILSSADTVVHDELSFKYAYNALKQGWMDQVRVILWGPTEKIAAEDEDFIEQVKLLIDSGVEVYACKSCSDNFGTSEKLAEIGIDVRYTGTFVTEMLKEGWYQLTF